MSTASDAATWESAAVEEAAGFYDGLAPRYDLLFGDWWEAAAWHGEAIARLLAGVGVQQGARLLDCACGIGTQALPLAQAGYDVAGTDLSVEAVARARREAEARGIEVTLAVADMRELSGIVSGQRDAVIVCDNALAHLQSELDIARALSQMRECLVPGGVLLASIRDYDALMTERPAGVPLTLYGEACSRHGFSQAWSWSEDGALVDVTLLTLAETAQGWDAHSTEARFRAWTRDQVTDLLVESGFADVRWMSPAESGYFQPVVTALSRRT